MFCFLFFFYLLSPIGCKLWLLTNSGSSIFLVLVIFKLARGSTPPFFLMVFLQQALKSEIPLNNTIFAFHPPALYLGFILITKIRPGFTYYPLMLGLFALGLGGFWSSQELNWGGWWNWDILETSPLLVLIFSLMIIHITNYKMLVYKPIIIYLLTIIFFLNKSGLTVSVHNFVTSKNIKQYWYLYLLFYLMFFIYIPQTIVCLFIISLYITNNTMIFFKYIFFVPLYKPKPKKFNPISFIFHWILILFTLSAFIFNYSNLAIGFCKPYFFHAWNQTTFTNRQVICTYSNFVKVRAGNMLCKLKPTLHQFYCIKNSRTLKISGSVF